jgi:hypothetical protein
MTIKTKTLSPVITMPRPYPTEPSTLWGDCR